VKKTQQYVMKCRLTNNLKLFGCAKYVFYNKDLT